MFNFISVGLPWWLSGKICLPVQEMWFQSLGQEDSLEKEMATQSSILAWEIPWTEEPGKIQSMLSQRVGHDLVTKHTHTGKVYLFYSCLNVGAETTQQVCLFPSRLSWVTFVYSAIVWGALRTTRKTVKSSHWQWSLRPIKDESPREPITLHDQSKNSIFMAVCVLSSINFIIMIRFKVGT